ncbi:MerR family transcriptional regulator [Hellea balneolensis]|uniref:MerR family transcriptional regulator n=1 Tax=Hellea balneolensis TaxID=287478 RepID=UPI000410414C|nr:MerR family transcriptional regulator [Hellea balneolensis]
MSKNNHMSLGEASWGIREFAEIFDVTPRTIRFYEDKGLLKPARNAGVRVFDAEDYLRFERIMRAKRIGFTLDDIKEVLEVTDGHIKDRVELLRRKKNFESAIRSLKRRREDIDVISRNMSEICAIISQNVENVPDSDGVFDLATAYDAKFKQTLADDYSAETLDLKG